MSQPFSRFSEPPVPPEAPRPFKRRTQPGVIVREAMQSALRRAQQYARSARMHGQELWRRGKRNPRTVGITAAAVAVTLVGAYALSASARGPKSLCPAKVSGKPSAFLVLMDPVPPPTAGSEMELHYDVCGLASGTKYRARVQLIQPQPVVKKKKGAPAPKPVKPIVIGTFDGKVSGPATRRTQDVELRATRPGTYTMELSVVDNKGRERKRLQKLVVRSK